MKTRLKTLLLCAVLLLLLGITPQALALWVGFNPDIHMDIQGVIANDFHVQGSIESGDPCGNWAQPPRLVGHIDGGFPNFKYSITPDKSDPKQQNWFTFTADWSGKDYQFCEVIHLGLFFDVDCHNVAVKLVGWWTKDGQPIPPNIVPPPLNGGAVPLPGFNVQDQPPHQMPQHIRLHNDSDLFDGGGGGGGGIETEMVQLELVSLTSEQLNEYLGPRPFEELRLGGKQEYLPWIAVENSGGVISERNPQPFVPDSFFDVFFDMSFPIHPVKPIVIPPGGFLIVRERLRYINNARQPDIRWDWMIHGAHESDLGDAPDSTNSFGVPPPPALMTAYPKGGPPGVIAHYPTVYQIGSPPFGPIHWAAPLIAFLGPMVSSEMEADIGPDMDPTNNIIPPNDMPDLDGFDDGVIFPIVLPHCQWTTFDYWVNIRPPMPPPMPQTPPLYVNVWFDWNRDGDWDDTMQCPGDDVLIPAPEWAVQNQLLVGLPPLPPPSMHKITTPPFMPWHPATGDIKEIWMRITLSEQPWQPTAGVLGNGGCGPQYGYLYGETEDYYFIPEVPEKPEHDLGDAPDSTNSFGFPPPFVPMTAYPKGGPPGILANYPSVYQIGSPPFGPIHMQPLAVAYLGPQVSLENEADIGPDQDPTNNIIPPNDMPDLDNFDDGVAVPLVLPHCQWTTFDYWVTIQPWMPPSPNLYVNVWFDWNRDGDWDDTMQCPGTTAPIPAPEWAVQNQPLVGLPVGLNKITTPRFMPWHQATGDMQPIWMRITLSEQKWNPTSGVSGDGGSGPANGYLYGETEDYYFVPLVPEPELDFGDAPEAVTGGFRYPTTLANNGARHIIVPGVCLGTQIDSEPDGQPTLAADGDDNNGPVNDEDGIIGATPLVPGASASVVIVASVAGSLSAWLDYNADGDWDDPCETVFAGQDLSAGTNTLGFTVPTTAVPGVTYARLRFTTADTALRYDGLADDGEVEDYLVEIQETPTKPPVEHLKWSQPPIEWDPWSRMPVYCGWDEPSYSVQLTGAPAFWKIVADDFRCLGTMPVTSIHWWGSYKGWNSPEPAMPSPIAWQIGFWTNVPPPPTGGISQPGKLLWLLNVSDSRVKEERVGADQFPNNTLPETCFQYYLQLNPDEYFRQERYTDSTTPNIYWISITAVYPGLLPPPEFPWGWKTRPAHWMDDAVTFTLQQDELIVGMTIPATIVRPLEGYICGQVESYDAAFELDTDPNWIKWEQAYTGIRDWPHYEDELSMGTQHTIVEPVTKYIQKPDLTETGLDVDATLASWPWRPQILADDFNCVTTGLITDIHIWGSWYHDQYPGKPDNVQFLLTIYSDDPIGPGGSDPSNKYSKPDQVLWRKMFLPGQFNASIEASNLKEGYFVPCVPYLDPIGDTVCWKYDFYIDPCEAFPQQGTTAKPVTYWLAVQAQPIVGPVETRFGWKTSFQHWNDDAVWASGTELPYVWNEMRYPPGHPYAGRSIDLAFAVTTETKKEELVIHRQVADDWRCKDKTPVTAIVWWGSYIGYRYEACQCQATTPRPIKPDYFLLQIWTNVSAGVNTPYSHPGGKVWEYKAYDYDEVLVGYDKHPEPGESGIGYEPVFRYSVKLPDPNWYRQKEVEQVFWLSVVAVYKDPLPVIYPWGWTNHQCVAWEPKGLNDEVAYWKLNETSGIIASDSSGNGNDGTLVGNATWTAGKICGGALDLDGNGDYVKTADTTTGLNFAPGSFSVSGWIKPRQVTGGYRTILEYDRNNIDKNRFGLWLNSEGKFHFRVGRDTKNSNQILTSNQWYLLTATYDSISKTMSLYIDGQFDSSGTHSNGFTSPNVTKLTIGVRGTEDAEYFDGLVDDIRIYNRALSASEVRALADMGKNDDAVAGYVSEAGMWVWEELYDQTGRSEDMSFVLFTDEPGCWLFPQIYTTYADWVVLGKPNCWCGIYGNPQWPYQCDGDADGVTQGVLKYRVFTNDFNILVANWKKTITDAALNPCADFDHKPQGVLKFRVFTNDFNILVGKWKKTDAQLPGNCVRPE